MLPRLDFASFDNTEDFLLSYNLNVHIQLGQSLSVFKLRLDNKQLLVRQV